jgi:hypothetical protein
MFGDLFPPAVREMGIGYIAPGVAIGAVAFFVTLAGARSRPR